MEIHFLYKDGPRTEKKKNSPSGWSKSKERSKSLGKPVKVRWKCGKEGHYKNDYRSKALKKGKGSNDSPFVEA